MSRADRLADRLSKRGSGSEGDDGRADPPAEAAPEDADQPDTKPGPEEEPEDVRGKFQAYVLRSVQDEAKAIVYWTNNRPGGYASLTELAEHALQREIERMRAEFNGGQPFPPMPPDQKLTTRPPRRGRR
nr:hypothetical protein [Streptomyces noursei]BAD80786.1 hypothetical protein [Streptomyces noursei]